MKRDKRNTEYTRNRLNETGGDAGFNKWLMTPLSRP